LNVRDASGRRSIFCRPGSVQAQRCHVARRETTPPNEDWRQGLPHLAGTKPQQPLPASPRECFAKAGRYGLVHVGRIVGWLADEMPMGRYSQTEMDNGDACPLLSIAWSQADILHATRDP